MGHILMDFLSSGSDASPGKSLWLMCMHDALSPAADILHISEPSLNLWFHSAKTQNLLSSTPATSQGSRNYNYWTVQSVMSCKFPVRVTIRWLASEFASWSSNVLSVGSTFANFIPGLGNNFHQRRLYLMFSIVQRNYIL